MAVEFLLLLGLFVLLDAIRQHDLDTGRLKVATSVEIIVMWVDTILLIFSVFVLVLVFFLVRLLSCGFITEMSQQLDSVCFCSLRPLKSVRALPFSTSSK